MATKKKKTKAPSGANTASPASSQPTQQSLPPSPPPPNWPALSPLIPETDLALEELLPNQIVTIPNLWTASLCKTYVSFLSSLSLTTTPGKPKKGNAVRVNDRFQIDDAAFAERLWSETALKGLITGAAEEGTLGLSDEQRKELWGGHVVGLNSNIRIYRYSKGQFFDQHCMASSLYPLSFRSRANGPQMMTPTTSHCREARLFQLAPPGPYFSTLLPLPPVASAARLSSTQSRQRRRAKKHLRSPLQLVFKSDLHCCTVMAPAACCTRGAK